MTLSSFDINFKDNQNDVALYYACGCEVYKDVNYDLVKLLLDNGANLEACDAGGKTPLHRAAQMNRLEIARYLIIHNANIDAETENRVKISERETRAIIMSFSKAKRKKTFMVKAF